MKSEVEMVIKTGRQIVQKKQTENPKELDERVTALKLHYNELGAKVCAEIMNTGYFPVSLYIVKQESVIMCD